MSELNEWPVSCFGCGGKETCIPGLQYKAKCISERLELKREGNNWVKA